MRYRAKHLVEYAVLRAVAFLFLILPYRVALVLAWGLARIMYHGVRWRVREARKRIHDVFPALSARGVRRIAWESMKNMCFDVVDVMRVPRMTPEWVTRHVTFEGWEYIEEARRAGRGGVIALPHMGSWDMIGVAAHLAGIPFFFIVGRQRNPLFDAFLKQRREYTGIETISRDHPMLLKPVLRHLKQGKFLGFTNDLRSKTKGLSVRFLGKQANLPLGMALFARQANAPVIPVLVTRTGWTRHQAKFHPLLWPDLDREKKSDWLRITQQVMDLFTAAVREQPGQYFWYNKRWVLDPYEE